MEILIKMLIIINFVIIVIASFTTFVDLNPKSPEIKYAPDEYVDLSPVDNFPSDEVHWTHMPLTFNYDDECSNFFKGKYPIDILNALEYISNKTDNAVTFEKVENNPDILFDCEIGNKIKINGTRLEIVAEAESLTSGNLFVSGVVRIYSPSKCLGGKPVSLIHETLHLLGLKHSGFTDYNTVSGYPYREGTEDIMHPENLNCFADISVKDVEYLKGIYERF